MKLPIVHATSFEVWSVIRLTEEFNFRVNSKRAKHSLRPSQIKWFNYCFRYPCTLCYHPTTGWTVFFRNQFHSCDIFECFCCQFSSSLHIFNRLLATYEWSWPSKCCCLRHSWLDKCFSSVFVHFCRVITEFTKLNHGHRPYSRSTSLYTRLKPTCDKKIGILGLVYIFNQWAFNCRVRGPRFKHQWSLDFQFFFLFLTLTKKWSKC